MERALKERKAFHVFVDGPRKLTFWVLRSIPKYVFSIAPQMRPYTAMSWNVIISLSA